MFSGKDLVYQEKRQNQRKYGMFVCDFEITNKVVDEIGPLLDSEIRSMLTPMAQYWLSEHEGMEQDKDPRTKKEEEQNNAGQSDTGCGDDGEGCVGEGEESCESFGSNPDSRLLVEDTE